MRGEDIKQVARDVEKSGSPPHARGRLTPQLAIANTNRITPACAGKTALSCAS